MAPIIETEVENVCLAEGVVRSSPWPLPLISSHQRTCGVSPTHPNKGTNDFNYGVIAESGVN